MSRYLKYIKPPNIDKRPTIADWRRYYKKLTLKKCAEEWRSLREQGNQAGSETRRTIALRARLLASKDYYRVVYDDGEDK